ncbi:flagellar motor protein MotB [Roseobacter sinensis]|uniref:Chemotaxis protein MotB n=1 Tax=Roseobacter sinensis TaxID=2931391 RepID=A0ABT3B8K3_9RHOB|nr:flagellar motor protein MotB [Roseobacter sp. WL0113]MCV3269868.1 chemotaxis protein MotB [Roseobacter sp. WL0113]
MAAQSNLAPVIIKRKKVIAGGHHGGAWKVAYADFVTAMMAFFMMMWLLNATTEQQRQGLADYFAPTIPVNRVSGGGDGAFGGESIFSEETLPQNGLGATTQYAAQQQQQRGDSGTATDDGAQDATNEELEEIIAELTALGGESTVMKNALQHIVTRITDEGLVIELFALDGLPLFVEGTDRPTELMETLVEMVASVSQAVTNDIAIGGHVRAAPIVLASNPVWDKSTDRATRTRLMLEQNGLATERMQRVTGHADREPVHRNPMATRNNRVEIVLLR